ncbi:MAG TPA: DNA gyrase subunit A, partial [Aquella sp.]|nr:DNA gyrase subunit A [Aquella sp.]
IESRKHKHDIGTIQIIADSQWITIKNGGLPIPIQYNVTENKWTPELIFGVLLTSGQYKKEIRTGSGKNGYGAKLANIFSKQFMVSVGNPYDKKTYHQVWENNMLNVRPPIIEEGYFGEPFVEVKFLQDFARFGYTEYPTEVLSLYAVYAAEIAFTLGVPIYFNGVSLSSNDILDYKKLTGFTTENYLVHYEYPEGTVLKDVKLPNGTHTTMSSDPKIEPIVKLCLIDTPDEGEFHAFSNTTNNREGGVHLELAYDIVNKVVIPIINNSIKRKKEEKVARRHALDKADLKRHLTVIISCSLENPRWKSQDKLHLTEPKPKIQIEEKTLKPLCNWEMAVRLLGDLEAKLYRDMGTGKRKRVLDLNGYIPAYYAGHPEKSGQCVLYEVEGKSAMGYAYNMKSEMTEEQRDYVGIFAQMGKPLNVMAAKLLTLINSKKYQRLIEALNLEEGVDYTNPENRKRLNYGALALLNDADVDGIHIDGLLLVIFYCRYRSLLHTNFLYLVRTPLVRIHKGSEHYKFYSHAQYHKFIEARPECKKWETKYHKGLATSNATAVADETKNPRIAGFLYDDTCPEYFELGFSKKPGMTNKRKEWIANYQLMDGIEELTALPISQFLNFELVQHAVANLARTIPRLDGLKLGQRKIIFGTYKHWGAKTGTSTSTKKTNHLANQVSEVSDYEHGEKSLIDTINRMNLSYPGTNNMRYFVPDSQ